MKIDRGPGGERFWHVSRGSTGSERMESKIKWQLATYVVYLENGCVCVLHVAVFSCN